MGKLFEETYDGKFQGARFTPPCKDVDTGVPLNPPPRIGGVQEKFELKITPYKELNSFTRRFVILLMFVQTLLLMTLVTYLFVRVASLERETSRLNTLAGERQNSILELSDQINKVRDECQNLFRSDCKQCGDLKSTDSLQQNLLLNAEADAQINKGDATARNFKRSSPEALHTKNEVAAALMRGGLPEIMIRDKGNIGPWFFDKHVESKFNQSQDFSIPSNRSCVKVLTDGFYFIYAQVYYLSDGGSNSFSITKSSFDRSDETMATCSSGRTTASRDHKEEISCFTATVARLRAGDALHLKEREMNRRILFRDGQTYFGITKLSLPL